MKYVRGIFDLQLAGIILAGVLLVGVAISAYFYHVTTIKSFKDTIETLNDEIAGLDAQVVALRMKGAKTAAENTALHLANTNFTQQVQEQNQSIEALKQERDRAKAAWQQAETEAAKQGIESEKKIAAILAERQRPGEPWHETWKRVVDSYYLQRKNAVRPQ